MNGKRRFLRASVLSVLGSSCTYPACQHCFTRLIRAANRFQCPRCGSGSKEAKQRYKLCLKVAEWSQLYVVTVFGSCLDKIFGTSASSLQRHLQGSIETWSNLASDGAQELLNQAVEQFFVGRNFLFGMKIPEGRAEVTSPGRVSLYNSRRHIIAGQIFPPDDGAFGFTVLDCYSRLLSSRVNGLQPESGTFSPDHLKKDLSNSGSIFSPSVNNADLWQQSFGLTSLNASQGSLSRESIDKDGHFNCPSQDFLCTNKHLDNTNGVSVTAPSIVSSAGAFTNKSPRPSFHNSSVVSENGRKVSGFLDCVLTSDPCDKELHKSWRSACGLSPISPPCAAAAAPSKNTKAAGIHQEGAEIWDDSIYSESLSEFLAKVESNAETPTHSCKNNSKLGTRRSDRRIPRMQRWVDITRHSSKEHYSIASVNNTDPPSYISQLAQCPSSPTFPFINQSPVTLSAETTSSDSLSQTAAKNEIPQNPLNPGNVQCSKHATFWAKKKGNRKIRLSQICSPSASRTPSLLKGTCRDPNGQSDGQIFAEREEPSLISKRLSDCKESYNVSSDLFDISKSPQDTVQDAALFASVKETYPEECSLNSPKTGSGPAHVPKSESFRTYWWSEITEESVLESPGSLPFAQSTPVMKQLPGPSGLGINRPPLKPLNGRSTSRTSALLKKAPHMSLHLKPSRYLHISKSPDLWGLHNCSKTYTPLPSIKRLSVSPLVSSAVSVPQRWRNRWSAEAAAEKDHMERERNVKRCKDGDPESQGGESGRKESKMASCLMTFNGTTESPSNSTVEHFSRVQAPMSPGDWSPELFIEHAPTPKHSDSLQRRLF